MVLKFSHFLFEKETGCPIETHDLVKNLENRQTAIEKFGYGPANPDDNVADNDMFWQAKAKMWKCSVENVKTMKLPRAIKLANIDGYTIVKVNPTYIGVYDETTGDGTTQKKHYFGTVYSKS